MSRFNDANDLAFQAVYGQHYEDNEPCERPDGITEKDGILHGVLRVGKIPIDLTGRPVGHQTWADLATEIQVHLGEQ
jgi:hypothetical protein